MKQFKKRDIAALAASVSIFLLLSALLHWLWIYDNKYTAGPPYGENGTITCTAEELTSPVFLIDGWEFYPGAIYRPEDFKTANLPEPLDAFIGQFSNFSYIKSQNGTNATSPFGAATYRIQLIVEGGPLAVSMELPEIFTEYQLWINGTLAARTGSGTQVDMIVDKQADIIFNVENRTHYYSGLYYPPAIGTPAALACRSWARTLFYSVLCVSSLTLALYCAVFWFNRKKEALVFHFGLLCLFFTVTCAHPFAWQAGLSGPLISALEDTGRIAMLSEAAWIGAIVTGLADKRRFARILRAVLPAACGICMFSVLMLIPALGKLDSPVAGQVISYYGTFIDACYLGSWLWLCFCAAFGIRERQAESWFIFAGGCCLGAGFLSNFLNNNRFEPIFTGWQTEYAGYVMVLVFAALMISKNRKLITHMEELVTERTKELHAVLEERKNFFSDMAHNLKAPIAAVHGFISLIREGDLFLDEELLNYIHMIEEENDEIYQRVQSLSTLNAYDRMSSPAESIPVNWLLDKVLESNEPDAGVMGIHLSTGKLESETAMIRGQKEKLMMLFENLVYNAISFTPEGGSIKITPSLAFASTETGAHGKNMIVFRVSDTGRGIAPEHLPHIFERFYVGREDKSEGSGLGLYISRMIVEEMGGRIGVESAKHKGTTFEIWLPLETT